MRYLRLVLFISLCFISVPAFLVGLAVELMRCAYKVGTTAARELIDHLAR